MSSRPPAATDDGLRDVHEALHLRPYIQSLWSRRSYIWFVAVSELRNRQMTSVLGNLWHLLNPILQITVYYLIFGVYLSGVDRGVDNYILFITVGVFTFADAQRATTAGGNSIVNNRGLVQAISFPRALLPITSTVTESLATVPSIAVVYAVALLTEESARWSWLLLPVVMAAQFWMNLGLALVAARATTHFRDLQQILPFVFRILLYTSGVIFSVEAFAETSSVAWLFQANPIYCYISIARWTVVGGALQGTWFLSAIGWTLGLLIVGFFWFRAAEERYGRE
jgi:teichoic acid transport system permease protein